MADIVFHNKSLDQLGSIIHEDVMNYIIAELEEVAKASSDSCTRCTDTGQAWFSGSAGLVGSNLFEKRISNMRAAVERMLRGV